MSETFSEFCNGKYCSECEFLPIAEHEGCSNCEVNWLAEHDKQIRAEVIDEILEHKLIIIDDDGQMWKVVSVGDIERIKEQNK